MEIAATTRSRSGHRASNTEGAYPVPVAGFAFLILVAPPFRSSAPMAASSRVIRPRTQRPLTRRASESSSPPVGPRRPIRPRFPDPTPTGLRSSPIAGRPARSRCEVGPTCPGATPAAGRVGSGDRTVEAAGRRNAPV